MPSRCQSLAGAARRITCIELVPDIRTGHRTQRFHCQVETLPIAHALRPLHSSPKNQHLPARYSFRPAGKPQLGHGLWMVGGLPQTNQMFGKSEVGMELRVRA
jgi:hypothetical protein